MIEFVAVRCRCGGVVMDAHELRGLVRVRCRKCRKRVWVQGDGKTISVTRVDDYAPAIMQPEVARAS